MYTGEEPALLITAFDANPIPVKYVSFASHENTQVEFLYNCGLDQNTKPPNMDTPQTLQDRNNNMKTLGNDTNTQNIKHIRSKCITLFYGRTR